MKKHRLSPVTTKLLYSQKQLVLSEVVVKQPKGKLASN